MPFGLYFKVCTKKVENLKKKNPRDRMVLFWPKMAKMGFRALKNSFPENESIFFYSVKAGDQLIPKGFDPKH